MPVASIQGFRAAALAGLLAVACGAFGAHGLKDFFAARPGAAEWWEKAVFYHFIHAVVLLMLTLVRPFPRVAFGLLAAGVIGFSGSLYLLALTGWYWLVFVTPVGGFCLLGGWLALVVGADKLSPAGTSDV